MQRARATAQEIIREAQAGLAEAQATNAEVHQEVQRIQTTGMMPLEELEKTLAEYEASLNLIKDVSEGTVRLYEQREKEASGYVVFQSIIVTILIALPLDQRLQAPNRETSETAQRCYDAVGEDQGINICIPSTLHGQGLTSFVCGQDKWLPALEALVGTVSKAFSKAFDRKSSIASLPPMLVLTT
jgi:hypothetical protein